MLSAVVVVSAKGKSEGAEMTAKKSPVDQDDWRSFPPEVEEPRPTGNVVDIFRRFAQNPGRHDEYHIALNNARNQIEAMTGNREIPVRIRLLDQRHDIPEEQRKRSIQMYGSLGDAGFCRELWKLNNDDRYDVYVVAQEVSSGLLGDSPVSKHDIEGGRVIVADFDDKPFVDAGQTETWHLPPSFVLKRENSNRHYWVGWQTEPYATTQIRTIHKQIIQRYGSDPAVCDLARIIRLAGFYSHKRAERTRYLFERGPGWLSPTSLKDHQTKLPDVKRKPVAEGDEKRDDFISERRLRFALKPVDPKCSRSTWIAILGAIQDATIMRDDHTYMEQFDKYMIADEWSSGELGGYEPKNYQDFDDVTETMDTLDRSGGEDRATIGSIIHAAKAAGMDEREHQLLRTAEMFIKHGNVAGDDDLVSSDGDYPQPLSATALVEGDFPRAEYAWKDFILAQHVNLLYGDGGTGKTLLALHIAVAITAGIPLFGHETKQMPALLVLAEDSFGETKSRLQAICSKFGVELTKLPLHTWCLPGFDANIANVRDDGTFLPGPFLEPLQRKLEELGPCLLVLDTVSDIATLDETKRLAPNALCKLVLGGLCREFSTTVLVNAHPSKAAMVDGTNYAGSTAWNNAVRNRLTLKFPNGQQREGTRRELHVAKANYGSSGKLELVLSPFEPTFATIADSDQVEREAREREAVLSTALKLIDQGVQIVRGNGGGQKPADLAKAVQADYGIYLDKKQVLEHLNALERDGKLRYQAASNQKRGVRTGFCRPEA